MGKVNNITTNTNARALALQSILKSKLNLDKPNKATPVEPDGYLLPSRIFGSPTRYVNNLKKDIVTIKKGATGKANDHELGRLNDLAMKTGSLLLAAYLLTTKLSNKTSKAMEFVGFGTFFASMALWPKLAIQAPIKARTGVDIHRKYVDSFGREKMFFQDPQYVPWALMSQKELDKMGDKLKIPKDMPNRNAAIQDAARKTAVQGNTLWMYTAGFATPLMSALASNALEPKVDSAIRNVSLRNTNKHLENLSLTLFQRIKKNLDIRKSHKFLQGMKNQTLDSTAIASIADRFANGDVDVSRTISEQLTRLAQTKKSASVPLTQKILDRAFQSVGKTETKVTLEQVVEATGIREISEATIGTLTENLARLANPGDEFLQEAAETKLPKALRSVFETERMPKVGMLSDSLTRLSDAMSHLKARNGIFDRFMAARTKDLPGTLLGKEYSDFNRIVIDSLGIRPSKKLLTDDEIIGRIEKFVDSDKFDTTVRSLGEKIETFHRDMGTSKMFEHLDESLDQTRRQLRGTDLAGVAERLTGKKVDLSRTFEVLGLSRVPVTRERLFYSISEAMKNGETKDALAAAVRQDTGISVSSDDVDKLKRVIDSAFEGEHGSMRRSIRTGIEMRILGAESSFYRTIQTFDIFRKIKNETLKSQLQQCGLKDAEIPEAIDYAKRFITQGTIVSHSDKAGYMSTAAGKKIHDAVMRVLFDDEAFPTEVGSDVLKSRLRVYKKEAREKISEILRELDAPLNHGYQTASIEYMQGAVKHNLVGEPIVESVKNGVKNMKNSNKWLKIFGAAFLALVGITLITGTQFGKTKKTKQKTEEGAKTNG